MDFDPRKELAHEIAAGQVYEDDRDGDEYRIVHEDDHAVLLRYNTDRGPRHVVTSRSQFEDAVRADRYTLVEPSSQAPRMPDEFDGIRSLLHRMGKHYARQGTRTGEHKAEAVEEILDEIDELATDSGEPIDFEAVAGVGAKAAENLRRAGFETERDVRRADSEDIRRVDLMGEANTENLIEHVGDSDE